MILLVDNYDSFTYNLERYLLRLGQQVAVVRNDSPALDASLQACEAIVLSPGPRAPEDAGRCLEIVQSYSGLRPILGVCLGHQAIFAAYGGRITRAARPIHGRCLPVKLAASPLLQGLPDPCRFARYHSLIADATSVPECLEVVAWSDSGEIMAIAHRELPTFGVQFHPESVLSIDGYRLLANFLTIAGLACPTELPASDYHGDASSPTAVGCLTESLDEHAVVLPRRSPLPTELTG